MGLQKKNDTSGAGTLQKTFTGESASMQLIQIDVQ